MILYFSYLFIIRESNSHVLIFLLLDSILDLVTKSVHPLH